MKFFKYSAVLAVASCFMINSIATATMKEEKDMVGSKPTAPKITVSSGAKPAKTKVAAKAEKVKLENKSKPAKAKVVVKDDKKQTKAKDDDKKYKLKTKDKQDKKQKEALKIDAKLDTKKAQEKVKPVKKQYFRGMEIPHNYKDISIFGKSVATKGQAINLIKKNNSNVRLECSLEEIVDLYWIEAEREGVRPDLALAQALVETGYFGFGGTVKPKQNNYCGLGTTGKKVRGAKFKNPEMGVRAHIQHLLAYSAKKPSVKIVDPRYDLAKAVRTQRGLVDKWSGLNGTWAMGSHYCEKIMVTYQQMLAMEMSEQEKKELLERQRLEQEQREARLKNDKKYRKQMEKEAKEREKARKKAEKEAKKRKQKEAEHKRHERVDRTIREDKAVKDK